MHDVAGGELVEAVLGVIVAHDLDRDGWSWPSQETIAAILEVTRETVNRIVQTLDRLRLLVKIKPKRYGRWAHCKYLIRGRDRVHLFRKGLLLPHVEGTAKAVKRVRKGVTGAAGVCEAGATLTRPPPPCEVVVPKAGGMDWFDWDLAQGTVEAA